jgi:hypothetical protein
MVISHRGVRRHSVGVPHDEPPDPHSPIVGRDHLRRRIRPDKVSALVTGGCRKSNNRRARCRRRYHSPRVGTAVDYEGKRPSGVESSTARGRSLDKRATISSRERPVCFRRASITSGPMALSRCGGGSSLLGPELTHESAASPWPFWRKRSSELVSILIPGDSKQAQERCH